MSIETVWAQERQHVVELLVEDLDEIGGLAGERVVAVAGAGELQHQVLVVAEAEADGADRDALAAAARWPSCVKSSGRRGPTLA